MRFAWNDELNPLVCSIEADAPEPGGGGPQDPPADPPAAADPAPEPPPAAAAPPPEQPDWRDRQIDRQHRKIKELEDRTARLAETEAENRRLRELAEAGTRRGNWTPEAGTAGTAPPPPAAIPAPASAMPPAAPAAPDTNALKEQVRFEVKVEQLSRQLETTYGDEWKASLANLQKAGTFPPELLAQIMETRDPAYVMVALGKNPARFQDILDRSQFGRMEALIEIAASKPTAPAPEPRRPSAAPPPPTSEHQRGAASAPPSSDIYDPRLSDEEFYVLRQRQKLESRGRPWSLSSQSRA